MRTLLATLLLTFSSFTHAAAMAITWFDVTGYGSSTGSYSSQGFQFRPNEDITVLELGYFDSFGDGLSRAYTMGIMAPNNQVLASVVVPNGTSGRLDGPVDPGGAMAGSGFRYAALDAPLTLFAGQTYAVVSVITPGLLDPLPLSPGFLANPSITFLGTWADCCGAENGTLQYPDEFNFGDFAVNFTFTTSAIPLPASAWLFVSALAGLGLLRRRA